MILDEITTFTQTLQWKCIESKIESKRLFYGRFAISPFEKGQANTVGIAMRRVLLSEIEGSSITCAKFENVKHEYFTLIGIQESVHDILINLKELIIRSDSNKIQKAYLSIIGPKKITAEELIIPSSVKIIDPTQHIATLNKAINFNIELTIEKNRGYYIKNKKLKDTEEKKNCFFIDSIFMPIRNVNYSVHSFGNEQNTKEILFLEIWTNGSITPKEALYEASQKLIDFFIPFLNSEKKEINGSLENKNEFNISSIPFQSISIDIEKITKDVAFKHIFIDQLELPARAYNCLKKMNVNTIADLLMYSENDLIKIKNFGKKSVEQVLEALKKRFAIQLQKNKIMY